MVLSIEIFMSCYGWQLICYAKQNLNGEIELNLSGLVHTLL